MPGTPVARHPGQPVGEICGVLPAAGRARRFGGPKLRVCYRGRPLVAWSMAALEPCDRVLAVVRPNDAALARVLRALGAQVVACDSRGMGASIAAAVRASRGAAGWCILPADMPWVPAVVTSRIVAALRAGAPVAAPFHKGVRGHPVGFSARCGAELVSLDGETGGRAILRRHAGEMVRIPIHVPGVLRDVDRPGDLRAV